MAEEQEEGTSFGAGPQTGSAGADPAAVALAIGSASREKADRYLEEQTALAGDQRRLIDDQRHHLHTQLLPAVSEKWLGVLLRVATVCVGLTFAGGVAWMVWEAKHSDGLKVEPFSVPPALAERGLTGQVVAARVIDRLSELQSQTNTARPARSYSNAWGDKAIKLEIPETGVSLEELDSWLRAKLGHETPLSGEVVRGETGVTLTARTTEGAVSVSGTEAEMDALTGKLAEAIYRLTQPYRYGIYLMRHENRPAEAAPIFKALALNGSAEDKRWSYNMWAQAVENAEGSTETGLRMYQQAHDADPNATGVYSNLVADLVLLGRIEEALQAQKESQTKTNSGISMSGVPPTQAAKVRAQVNVDLLAGGYHGALPYHAQDARTGRAGYGLDTLLWYLIRDQIGMHDLAAAQISQAAFLNQFDHELYRLLIAVQSEGWATGQGLADAMAAFLKSQPHDRLRALVAYAPPLALAQAHLGNFAAAEKTIAPTPADCYPCLIARAQIAELAGQGARAEYWFTRATEAGPSLPFAFEAEGRALLGRGLPDAAIARFTIATEKGPHFADPLEGWGEALMAKNQSHLALAKFAEAAKFAPNWGRLHLKWGEALNYVGKKEEAKKQFTRAAELDLTPAEKAELARHP